MKRLYVGSINDCVPDMSGHFEILPFDQRMMAHAAILWCDVLPEMVELCIAFQKAKIPIFVMQHGYGATKDYLSQKRIPHGDYLFCWTEWDKVRAVEDGWDEKKVIVVGCPLLKGLHRTPQESRPKVLFIPAHSWTPDADTRNTHQAAHVWHLLAQIPEIRPVVKLLSREHDPSLYPGEKVFSDRWNQEGHLKIMHQLLSDASLMVTQDCGTLSLLAYTLDIPVIKLRNPENLDEGCVEIRAENLVDTVREHLAHPELKRDARFAVAKECAGTIEDGEKVADRIAATITEILDKGAERVYTAHGANPSITCFRRFNEACDYYRCALPFIAVEERSNLTVNLLLRNMPGTELPDSALNADIFFMPGFDNIKMKKVVQNVVALGKKVIIDWDDNVFSVSPLSPHYEVWGTEQVRYKWDDGQIVDVWVDGKNIDLKQNRERLDVIAEVMADASALTVTTPILAEEYRKYNPNVLVLPNCIDIGVWKKINIARDCDEIRLFWGGGASHYEDWMLLENVLPYIMDMYRNVKLVVAGTLFKGAMRKLPMDRVEFKPWVPIEAYPYATAIADPDIGIIPLRDTIFNRCKSSIKWVEMGALSVPCVTSGVSPYKEIATEKNGIFIEDNSPEAWIEGLEILLGDQDLRQRMGNEAHNYVVEHFDINTQYYQWVQMAKEVVA